MKNEIKADEFKVGDAVWCLVWGKGVVTHVYNSEYSKYPVHVMFTKDNKNYTNKGQIFTDGNRTLFFSEPKVEGSVTRPFVSKLIDKKVVINTSGDLCIIGTVEAEFTESIVLDSIVHWKDNIDAIYEITSDNLLEN